MADSPPVHDQSSPTAYTVLARRYRPQTFLDLVGQEPVARALTNALKGNRVAHAYLFTGARGVGKTSTARILAKALNCEQGPTPTPCGVCSACVGITSGDDVDVLEIDGASNNGVESIRELRSNVQYSPARSRFKIYIIDEVHMLSKGAFNALLKTLEEPPAHVKFIFATTEVEKVPITILSRCQRFDFPGIATPAIVARLAEVVGAEGMQADEEALELVARRAGGSMRDAQSLLDQLLAFGGDRLTVEQVHRLLGTAGDDRIAELAATVLGCETGTALTLLDDAVAGGLQLGELVDQLIAYWHDLMVVHVAGVERRDLSVPPRHRDALAAQARALSLDSILAGLDVLSATKSRLRGSSHGRTLVEMALVRLGRMPDLIPLAQVAQWVAQGRVEGAGGSPTRSASSAPVTLVRRKEPPRAVDAPPVELNEKNLPAVWGQTLSLVRPMLASELEKAGIPAIFGPNTLVLRFPGIYTQSREYVQKPERLTQVEEALRKATGRPWVLRVESLTSTEAATTAAPAALPAVPARTRPRKGSRDEAEKIPLIRRALDILGAQVKSVDEGFGTATGAVDLGMEEEV